MSEYNSSYTGAQIDEGIRKALAGSVLEGVEATTLSEGAAATAEIESNVLKLGIPRGNTGAAGSPGAPGTSVNVSKVTESSADGGSNVVEFSDGTTLTIKNGSKGGDGATGQQGVSVTNVEQTTTSDADGGSNVITVTLSNGETFTFTVKNGSKGSTGAPGSDGSNGANATINGANALTITVGSGISGSQSGTTYTISLASHNQAASTITAGTFAGQVVANASAQTPATALLRNSKLVTSDTNPTNNGEICWTYE